MGLAQLNFAGLNKVEVAIARLKEFEPPEPYYFADSYGKDSCVVKRLLDMAGIQYDAHYSQGGIDPPELVYFGRKYHPDTIVERPEMSIWEGIMINGFPTRKSRWCCELIKEKYGADRRVVTGIRWQESPHRAKRQMVEVCRTDKTKTFIHPIIDWTIREVWEFIHKENIPYCSLYNEGFKRLGCVLCPMLTAKQTQIQIERFPKITEAWHRAFQRFYLLGWDSVKRWSTAEEMWQWWLTRKGEPKINEAQCIMFDN